MKKKRKTKINGRVYKSLEDYHNSNDLSLRDIFLCLWVGERIPQNGEEEQWEKDIQRALKKGYKMPTLDDDRF